MTPHILFLDAYDSFSNNIISLLTTLLEADVSILPIDHPDLNPCSPSFGDKWHAELSRFDAIVCGPGPGSPVVDADVGLMRHVWTLTEEHLIPVLGICLGFQSLVCASGGGVRRLRRGLHGMVREIEHAGAGGLFEGVGEFKATLYHSLGADVGQDGIEEAEWREGKKWEERGEIVPLAWVEEEREDGRMGRERILMAVKHKTKPLWGLQYHPESVCTEEEGNKVIMNWFHEAMRWNMERMRMVIRGQGQGQGIAGAPIRASLLSLVGTGSVMNGDKQWWESVDVDGLLHTLTVPLPWGLQVPDLVEIVAPEGTERVVLDSANAAVAEARGDVRGRYSIIATGLEEAPRIEHQAGDDFATVKLGKVGGMVVDMSQRVSLARHGNGSIWGFLAAFHEGRNLESTSDSPFVGGFVGYITYEQGLHDIDVPVEHPRSHDRPDVCLAWVTRSLVVDHLLGLVHIQHIRSADNKADPWVEKTAARLVSIHPLNSTKKESPSPPKARPRQPSWSTQIQTPLTREYESKVSVCQEYIAAGDSYELCLTSQSHITRLRSSSFTSPSRPSSQRSFNPKVRRPSTASSRPPSSWSLFKSLRTRQPAPFASYIRLGPATLVSASPERFLQYSSAGKCSMRPMKGTVRKSPTVATLADAERILHVPKEEAENLMIVDLVRHDLHAVCGAGRVAVSDLLRVEEYQSVFQMITVVEGDLPQPDTNPAGTERIPRDKYTGLDVLAASLPPGSMTGAPKKRSCEILRHIEEGKERSLYSGVVGYMCATGRGDWSVTIRSLFRWDDEVVAPGEGRNEDEEGRELWHIGAGGAVTILSTPEGERDEMFTKLAGSLRVFADS